MAFLPIMVMLVQLRYDLILEPRWYSNPGDTQEPRWYCTRTAAVPFSVGEPPLRGPVGLMSRMVPVERAPTSLVGWLGGGT